MGWRKQKESRGERGKVMDAHGFWRSAEESEFQHLVPGKREAASSDIIPNSQRLWVDFLQQE